MTIHPIVTFQIKTNLTQCDKMTNFGDMVIYDIHGSKLMDAILTEGAVLERELGKTDVVKLSWNSDFKKTLPVGSYIVPFDDGLKYRLLDDYTPSEGSTSLKYEPVFNHPLAILSRIPFLYDTTDQDGNPIKQQEWPYDGLTTNALEYACKAINEALGITDESKKFTYTLCGTVDPTISFYVSSNDILSVLSSMAQACKDNSSEWHLSWEDHTLYFGQIFINLGEKVPLLKVHDNINPATVNSSNEPYYNCFYPQGSSRNMSRKAQVGLGNVATLVRLGLNKNKFPDGCIYVDKDSNVITKDAFLQSGAVKQMVALSFDDVYPHIDLYAYNVRPRYRYLKNKQTNEIEKDASGKNKVYTTWYMRLAYPTTVKDGTKTLVNTTNDIDEQGKQVTHYWYDYELNVKEQVLQGHTLKGTFKVNTHTTNGKYDALTQLLVGQPNGQDGFELAYFDKNNAKEIPSNQNDGDSGINIKAGDYQIMFYQNGDVIVPTNQEEGLYPRGNNLPDLTCNIVVLFNIKQGQQEITSAQEELAKRTVKEIERRFKDNNNYTFSSNPVAFEEKNPKLHIGQKVIFNDGQGYELSTRVIKIESKIDFPFIQSITVGNQAVKGAITQLKEDVKNILSGNFSGGGGLNASQIETVIKNYTLPRFLRKDIADTAEQVMTFLKGIVAKAVSYFEGIVNRGDISNTGDIHNTGDIINAGDITTKNLTVTDKATFFELEMQKAKAAGGMSVYSPGAFHIDEVVDAGNYYACYQRAEQDGVKLRQMCDVDDQLMCARFNVDGNGNKFYWMRVAYASPNTVQRVVDGKFVEYLEVRLDKSVKAKNCQGVPEVGDALAVFGNRTKEERQSVIVISAYNSFDIDLHAPYIAQYEHVNDFNLENKKTTWLSKGENHLTGTFTVVSGGKNVSLDDFVTKISQATFKVEADKITARIDGVEKTLSDTTKNYSELQITLNSISSTVARKSDLEDVRTEIKQTAEEINLTVNNGTRPNLLWGSDLDLSGVQDVMERAYAQGGIIKKKTEEKAEWKRSRDNADSDDDRMRFQEGMDDCDREIAQAQGEVAKCKEAIGKHLGVGLNATKVDNTEWFEYLKGGGVGGSDAIKFYTTKDASPFAGLYWEVLTGASHNLRLKPNTAYTLSAWIRTEFDKDAQGYSNFAFEAFKKEKEDSAQRVGGLSFKTASSWRDPINEWTRVSTSFTTEELKYGSVAMWMNGTKPSTLYLCRPKLEEGNTATPWCAYDGTVDALLAGGFDIKEKKFTATADNFVVQNNRGEQTFMVDENGRINNGMLTSRLRLTEPTIITKENYKEFCYNGKLNGHNVLFLDLLKCGTLLVLTDVPEELFLDLPSFKYFKSYNNYTQKEVAKEQYDKMRYIGNTIILYNIDSRNVYVSGVLKYKKMEGTHDYGNLDEFGFYALERISCTSSVLACFECKFGITKPEKSQPWFYRMGGVYWEFCSVTLV